MAFEHSTTVLVQSKLDYHRLTSLLSGIRGRTILLLQFPLSQSQKQECVHMYIHIYKSCRHQAATQQIYCLGQSLQVS